MKMPGKMGYLACALVGASFTANAQINPSELEVQGRIAAPSCQVTTDDGGTTYDYGLMWLSILHPTQHVALEPKKKIWTVACADAKTYVSYTVTDLQSGTESLPNFVHWGLGRMDGRATSRIGYYRVQLSEGKVDGASKSILALHPNQPWALWNESMALYQASEAKAFGWASATGSSPWSSQFAAALGSTFQVTMEVVPALAPVSTVGGGEAVTEKVELDGNLLLSYAFGV